jgi:hypothetical protein
LLYKSMDLCAKILLYLGLKTARLVDRPERTEAIRKLSALAPNERKKAGKSGFRVADNVYDFIEVGPERSMAQEHEEAVSRGGPSKVFWRRGHFRMQAYGPRWSLRRERYFAPALVNAGLLSSFDVAPPARDYMVGGEHGRR